MKMLGRRLTDIESEWAEIIESDRIVEAVDQISHIYTVSAEDIAIALKKTALHLTMLNNNYRKMHGLTMRRRLTKYKRLPRRIKRRDK